MALAIIVVGDMTSHGGRVISGSDIHTIGGKAIARLHDLVDCPEKYPDGKSHGINKITEAHPTLTIGGERVALHGHHTECGCMLIGSTATQVGD
ncbi:PAAR domain-containing protein [Burkholderia anthina]|uniref:PAAR domain-containing protein n=1 Tax=Burkholderia anthina TaxID=179879 RepID=UPI00292DE5A6|nr:PAAR domain-containing protein [Burkholderia anthina]WJN77818.1 T6SS PAAR-repeat protein [Burkholderia anthina]